MPTIAFFYGIAIRMYLRDHLPPHFHAFYGDDEAQVAIKTGDVIYGSLPPTARRLVKEWARLHRNALSDNWSMARSGASMEKIDGLDVEQGR